MTRIAPTLALVAGPLLAVGCAGTEPKPAEGGDAPVTKEAVVASYAEVVARSYRRAHEAALALDAAVDAFLAEPSAETLAAAKAAWLASREPYGETEAFRFYEGPIDFVDLEAGREGPEGRLNAWPLNEAFIDYVHGDPDAGLIQDTDVALTTETIAGRNAVSDEANVTTGFHAVEFLLWGQDRSPEGPGARPVSDYVGDDPITARRREYLRLVTDLLVADLEGLVDAWAEDAAGNYRDDFVSGDPDAALGDLLTGIATLAGFELASERIAVPLDSSDQEDEHSCFSDNTHEDYVHNVLGIEHVYHARVGEDEGAAVHDLIAARDPELAERVAGQVAAALEQARAIEPPVDRILATEPGSAERAPMEALVTTLQELARSLKEAGEVLGVEVVVAAE